MLDPKQIKNDIVNAPEYTPAFFRSDFIIPAHHHRYVEYKRNNFSQFPGSEIEDGILYAFNSDGHRSDEFKKNHDGKHILFSGCSETFGVSAEAETTWPYMLFEKINAKEKTSGFFRLAFPGGGFQLILKGIINYINMYGAPDELFILFPHLERRVEFKDYYFYNLIGAPMQSPLDLDDRYRYSREEYNMWFFEMKERMILFEKYCKAMNIKLYWSFFMNFDNTFNEHVLEYENYVKLKDYDTAYKWIFDNYSREQLLNKEMFMRADGHAGIAKHAYWATKMWEARNENNL